VKKAFDYMRRRMKKKPPPQPPPKEGECLTG